MKKIKLALFAMIFFAGTGFAQTKKAPAWPQMKTFHSFMSSTFHPSEEGNLKPLREKADSLYITAKAWSASTMPSNYKPEETKAALTKLLEQCDEIASKVKANASDEELKKLITEAHDTFHKIVGECKKADE
jgi:hypothetical protein